MAQGAVQLGLEGAASRVGRDYEAVIRVNSQSGKIGGKELWELFRAEYLDRADDGPVTLAGWRTGRTGPGRHDFTGVLRVDGRESEHTGSGNGPLTALTAALAAAGTAVDVLEYVEHATAAGRDAPAAAYAECRVDGVTRWGAGRDTSVLTASVRAVLSAVNRAKRPA